MPSLKVIDREATIRVQGAPQSLLSPFEVAITVGVDGGTRY